MLLRSTTHHLPLPRCYAQISAGEVITSAAELVTTSEKPRADGREDVFAHDACYASFCFQGRKKVCWKASR
ncbi:hypothetical protein TSAR_004558 [Trichomalopsis sarcophagae]|uniref:Uncharacterized protein n=1 Tax=Trichomalopsis sarcophagae TaxID=543379 RepID=A0A232EVM5_9HYME|nr:hypothetical protein TSAR_004558 [Trichomalopsis sarcophagae]